MRKTTIMVEESGSDGAARHGILAPGRNCWRREPAERAAVLVDAATYFAHLESALRQARRSIRIVGWDFDGRVRLRPDADPQQSPPIGPLLRALVEAQPDLEVHILVWSTAVVHAPGSPGELLFGATWQEHPRIHFKLDRQHPIYAAHHQKIACVDDRLAFVGGIDITVRRWDTPAHADGDPRRRNPDGKLYTPVHDIQMLVDGDAGRAVAALARERWQHGTGETPTPVDAAGDANPWPAGLAAQFRRVPVAIARTLPGWNGQTEIDEAITLTLDALSAARRTIYIEAQYLTASRIGDVLEEQLRKPDGPEIVVVTTLESHGLAERLVMGNNRDRLIRRLRQADHGDRLRVCYPCTPAASGGRRQIIVHAKLIIVDDVFLRVGSSNLNNRSIGLDTECDLAIEAQDAATRSAITSLRNRLIGEHVDASPGTVTAAIEEAGGSLVSALAVLNRGPRGLADFEAMHENSPTRPVFGTALLDPGRPFRALDFLRRHLRQYG